MHAEVAEAVQGGGTTEAGAVQGSGTAEVGAVLGSGTAQALPRCVSSAETEAVDVDAMPKVKAAEGGGSQLLADAAGRICGGSAGVTGKMIAMEADAARLLAVAGAALPAGEVSVAPPKEAEAAEEECRARETEPAEAAWAYEENGVFPGRLFALDFTTSSEGQWEGKDGAAAAAAGVARCGVGGDGGGSTVGDARGSAAAGPRPVHSVVLVGLWDAVAAAGVDGGGTRRYGGNGFSVPEPTVMQRLQRGYVDGMHSVWAAVTHGITQDIHKVWGVNSGEGWQVVQMACTIRGPDLERDRSGNRKGGIIPLLCLSANPPCLPIALIYHKDIEDDARVVAMHQAAEIFEPETEMVYKYLQVKAGIESNLR